MSGNSGGLSSTNQNTSQQQNQYSTTTLPQWLELTIPANYQQAVNTAQNLAGPYTGPRVAGMSDAQTANVAALQQAVGGANPAYGYAQDLAASVGTGAYQPGQVQAYGYDPVMVAAGQVNPALADYQSIAAPQLANQAPVNAQQVNAQAVTAPTIDPYAISAAGYNPYLIDLANLTSLVGGSSGGGGAGAGNVQPLNFTMPSGANLGGGGGLDVGSMQLSGTIPQLQANGIQAPGALTAQQIAGQNVNAGPGVTAQQVQGGTLPGVDLQQYMNPYTQNVIDTSMQSLNQQRQQALNQNADAAIRAGAFGGSRHGIVEAVTNAEAAREAGLLSANLNQANFTQATQNAQTDLARLLEAAGLNQTANLRAGEFNAGQNMEAQLANQSNALRVGELNQAANLRAGEFSNTQAMDAALANQQNQFQTGQANQQSALDQVLQQIQAQSQMESARMNASASMAGASAQAAASVQSAQIRADVDRQNALLNAALEGSLANQTAMTGAGQFNSQLGFDVAQANQANALNVGNANAANQLNASLANQGVFLNAGQFNATNAMNAGQFNANLGYNTGVQNLDATMQALLANQGAGVTVGLANQGSSNWGQGFNATNNLNAALANAMAQQQAQQFYGNQALNAQQLNQGAGLSAAQLNTGNQLNASQLMGNLGTNQQNAYLQSLAAAMGGNQLIQDQQQNVFNAQQQAYQEAQQYPLNQLNILYGALGMSPYGTNTASSGNMQGQASGTTYTPGVPTSGAMQGIGAGLSLAGLFGSLVTPGAGGFSAIGNLLNNSDREDKTDIKKVGKQNGLDIYSYRYKGDPKSYPKVVGPMAQDIEKKHPEMVKTIGGKKAVDANFLAGMMNHG